MDASRALDAARIRPGIGSRPTGTLAWVILWALLLGTLAGCGYSAGSLYREDIGTVAVGHFGNRVSTYPGIEFQLTEAVQKRIERQTPFKIAGAGQADTVLEGRIIAIEQTVVSRAREVGTPREMEVRMVVDFEWRDRRSGDVLRRRDGLIRVGRYVPARPGSQGQDHGLADAVERMADAIVSLMREDWSTP